MGCGNEAEELRGCPIRNHRMIGLGLDPTIEAHPIPTLAVGKVIIIRPGCPISPGLEHLQGQGIHRLSWATC